MDSATKQFEREFFVGFLGYHYHPKSGRLPQEFRDRFHRVASKRGLQYQHVTSELLHRRKRLAQSLSLTYNADIILEGKYFAKAGAEDSLRVGDDDTNEVAVGIALRRLPGLRFSTHDRNG